MSVSFRALAAGAAVLVSACAREAPPATPAVNDVVIVGTDFAFTLPDTIPAGMTRLRLVSNGPRYPHHAQLIKLEDGKTYDSLMAAFRNPGPPPAWAVFLTGPNAPAPNDTTSVTVGLEPGNYALVCFIPDSAGVPHLALGMSKALTVVASSTPAAPEPTASMELRLTDYDFTTATPLAAGRHVIKVINDGPQPHEMFVARLDSGSTAQQFIQWTRTGMRGQPRITPMGGIVAMAPGRHSVLELNLTPGRYALFCFLPDASGRGEHVDHGMVKEITVT